MPKPKYVSFDLDEVIYFMKEGDFSFFDFDSDHGQGYAQVLTKEVGWLCIYNVPDKVIPAETVRRVLDVLEHWDECLKQAYDWLRFWDFKNEVWNSEKEWYKQWSHDGVEKEFEVMSVDFGEEGWTERTKRKYRLGPNPKNGSDYFSIDFHAGQYHLGFNLKFLCEDRRLYQIETYIIF